MRNPFVVPLLSRSGRTLLSFVATVIVVFGTVALLKSGSGAKQAPDGELVTGFIQRSPAIRKAPSTDPMAAFLLAPSAAQFTHFSPRSGFVVHSPVPLPRPRPKRL
jgi:hypothetical protein